MVENASVAILIQRARSALKSPTLYFLGKGGKQPNQSRPHGGDYVDLAKNISDPVIDSYRKKVRVRGFDPDKLGPLPACDCSGFVWWVLGEARKERNTDWIHDDARHAHRKFWIVSADNKFLGRPGDLLVYAHHDKTAYGHVGIITEVASNGNQEGLATRVIHCSAGNMALPPQDGEYPSSIAETGVEVFREHYDAAHPSWSTLVCRPWMLRA